MLQRASGDFGPQWNGVKLLINEDIQCTARRREPGGPDYFCRVKEPDRPDTAGQGQVKVLITEKEPPAVEVRQDDQALRGI